MFRVIQLRKSNCFSKRKYIVMTSNPKYLIRNPTDGKMSISWMYGRAGVMREKPCLYHLFEGTNKEMSVISEYECIRLFKKHSGGKREPFSLFENICALIHTRDYPSPRALHSLLEPHFLTLLLHSRNIL